MGKKEFTPKPAEPAAPDAQPAGFGTSGVTSKLAVFGSRLFSIIKLLLAACMLPFVYFTCVGFLAEFGQSEHALQVYFWRGVLTLIVVHLFIWEPVAIYTRGHRLMELLFTFIKPLVRVAPYLLPIYAILVFLTYQVLSNFVKTPGLVLWSSFAFGLTMALHLVFGAKTLRSKKEDFLKGNYLFGFSFVFILDCILLAAFMSALSQHFSFIRFCTGSYQLAIGFFEAIFRQLFVNP